MHTIYPAVDNVLRVKVSGSLSREEYADLVPAWEKMIAEYGKLRLLFEMDPGFTGWGPLAAWTDLKFSATHRHDIERVAIVGDKGWETWVAKLSALLVDAQVRYFALADLDEAQRWLRE